MDSVESVQYESAYYQSYDSIVHLNESVEESYQGPKCSPCNVPMICILIPLKEIDLDVFYQLCVQNQE